MHAMKEVQEQQLTADGISGYPVSLIQGVAIRWNSNFLMLHWLLELHVPIKSQEQANRCQVGSLYLVAHKVWKSHLY